MSAAAAPTSRYKTEIYLVYTRYIPSPGYILIIFHVYTWYIPVIYIQKVYTWYIPGIYLAYDHLCRNPGIYIEKTFWVCSVPVTYPFRHVISQEYPWSITCLSFTQELPMQYYLGSTWEILEANWNALRTAYAIQRRTRGARAGGSCGSSRNRAQLLFREDWDPAGV